MAIPAHYDALSALELVAIVLLEVKGDWTWAALDALRGRDRDEVFAAAGMLLRSPSSRERARGAELLIQAAGHDAKEHRESRARCAEVLLSALDEEKDASVLQEMGHTLGYIEDARAVPALRPLKDHPDARVREGVVRGLMPHPGDSTALQTLMELSRDGDTSVRKEVLSGLALKGEDEVDTPELRDAFLERLSEEDSGIRADALVGLAKRKDPRALEPLRRELAGSEVIVLAVEAAQALEDLSLLPLLHRLRDPPGKADSYFRSVLSDAIAHLESLA
ncbi:HEAT repeat domain-containing protein [Corallococcus exiguus]|nr:HEAT repeat domain-containing protein [Corallococcus exiguus]